MLEKGKARPKNYSREGLGAESELPTAARKSLGLESLTPSNESIPPLYAPHHSVSNFAAEKELSRREAFGMAKKEFGKGLVKLLRTCNLLKQDLNENFLKK